MARRAAAGSVEIGRRPPWRRRRATPSCRSRRGCAPPRGVRAGTRRCRRSARSVRPGNAGMPRSGRPARRNPASSLPPVSARTTSERARSGPPARPRASLPWQKPHCGSNTGLARAIAAWSKPRPRPRPAAGGAPVAATAAGWLRAGAVCCGAVFARRRLRRAAGGCVAGILRSRPSRRRVRLHSAREPAIHVARGLL